MANWRTILRNCFLADIDVFSDPLILNRRRTTCLTACGFSFLFFFFSSSDLSKHVRPEMTEDIPSVKKSLQHATCQASKLLLPSMHDYKRLEVSDDLSKFCLIYLVDRAASPGHSLLILLTCVHARGPSLAFPFCLEQQKQHI